MDDFAAHYCVAWCGQIFLDKTWVAAQNRDWPARLGGCRRTRIASILHGLQDRTIRDRDWLLLAGRLNSRLQMQCLIFSVDMLWFRGRLMYISTRRRLMQ